MESGHECLVSSPVPFASSSGEDDGRRFYRRVHLMVLAEERWGLGRNERTRRGNDKPTPGRTVSFVKYHFVDSNSK